MVLSHVYKKLAVLANFLETNCDIKQDSTIPYERTDDIINCTVVTHSHAGSSLDKTTHSFGP